MSRPLRILHCPHGVGGHPQGLARAERGVGLDSRSVVFSPSPLAYGADEILFDPPSGRLLRELRRWQLLARGLRDFDVVHFNFGSSIMPVAWPPSAIEAPGSAARSLFSFYARLLELRDLPLLKRAGKGICVTFQGDDARQADFCRATFEITHMNEVPARLRDAELDRKKRATIAAFERHADRIYALNPDLLRILPARAEFLPYGHLDLREWRPVQVPGSGAPVVVHAPSDRDAKGTRFVLEAVTRLRSEGVALEFALVEGLPRDEARRVYERADLAIDQVLAGWYGGLAVELMALGKPVVAYIRQDDLRFVPEPMGAELPVIGATPSTLYAVLKEWLTSRRAELAERGRRSRAYVERWHDPRVVARHLKHDYETIVSAENGRE